MEHLMHWIVELNRHHHTGYGMLTVATMTGMGCVFASFIELLFVLLGIRYHTNSDRTTKSDVPAQDKY
jgi:hypothetical protein